MLELEAVKDTDLSRPAAPAASGAGEAEEEEDRNDGRRLAAARRRGAGHERLLTAKV
jgi:hypothetical protein